MKNFIGITACIWLCFYSIAGWFGKDAETRVEARKMIVLALIPLAILESKKDQA